LRYSATHVDKHHMVYRLDAVDAYERKLVKQIEVASVLVHGGHNKGYVKLISTSNVKGSFSAKVEVDVQAANGIQRKTVVVRPGDDLEQITGRPIYADLMIKELGCKTGEEFLELSTVEEPLRIGKSIGDVDADLLKRLMIRRTIEEHLEKELRLRGKGIKVLSLFFIDMVEHYRSYDEDGNPIKGKYAVIFEEEYGKAITNPRFRNLFNNVDVKSEPQEVHDGYFSIDKNKRWTDTTESNQTSRESAERAYNLIMREKEKLLGFETKLKFIFSHSALREGWDNPNVFQICALRDIGTERERRQTIGRGLRLCVNQDGARVRGFDVNTLTVVATEEYEKFAENLQREIEEDTGIRFGLVEKHQFAGIITSDEDGKPTALGVDQSEKIWNALKEMGYVDSKGKVQDKLRQALKDGTVELPDEFREHEAKIVEILRKLAGKLDIKNADDRKTVNVRKGVLQSPEFQALWERIRDRTTYRVKFDNAKLLADCTVAVQHCPPVSKTSVRVRKADISIGRGGVVSQETSATGPMAVEESDIQLPDILTELQDKTQLTRRSLVQILKDSGRLDDFKLNPQQFIELVSESINRTKRLALVDGIKYQKLGAEYYYAQELFDQEELTGYLKNMVAVSKSVYEQVVYDSATEKTFAEELERNEGVKLYAKLPGWFKVPTPLGSYNPDWAVLVEKDGTERLYFVVETKSSLFTDDLRDKESAKIECGKAHFKTLAECENPARFIVARDIDDLLAKC